MQITVSQSEVKGKVKVPSSKSQTIRGLMCAALAAGESEVINPLVAEDTEAAAEVLGQIGVVIKKEAELWRVAGGKFRAPEAELHCGESATTMRFMTAICALVPGTCRLVGGPSLSQRPVKSLVEALKKLGVKCSMEGKTTPPVTVEGGTLRGGVTDLPGNISSQFISGLLLIAPLAKKEVSIRLTTELTSRPYLLMTLQALRRFGISVRTEFDRFVASPQQYKPVKFRVEGDWSSASYFLALGAVSEEGVEVENLSTSSLQGDRVMLDFLRKMGARVRIAGGSVTVSRDRLKAIRVDLSDCIDLLPTVAVLSALADGTSEFIGIERARIKESNRVAAVREGLERLGVAVTEDKNRLTVAGLATRQVKTDEYGDAEEVAEEAPPEAEPEPEEVLIDSKDDHRIAMAFSIIGTARGGVSIGNAECVAKTFPDFWATLKSIGGKVTENE